MSRRRAIRLACLAPPGALIAYACAFVMYALIPRAGPADVIVIPGNQVLANGQASKRLAARLDAGLRAYEQKLAPRILVSGGRGESGFDEAAVMRDYLVHAGIPESAILVDSEGVNTKATALNATLIMQRMGLSRAMAVTQYFHIPRCLLAFRKTGVTDVTASYPIFFEARDVYSLVRELVAYPRYALFEPELLVE